MSRRYSARSDTNQAAIVEALRRAGCTVESLHRVGGGVPDLLVGWRGLSGRPFNLLLEVKTTLAGKLTLDEAAWHGDWEGQVDVVRDPQEAVIIAQNYRRLM